MDLDPGALDGGALARRTTCTCMQFMHTVQVDET
tara:strand:+ start:218 stop:319 length:102 start_codon:yes stop_codon:yes gene_type:complete